MLAGTARRIARLLESRAEEDDDALARDEPLLAALAAASLRARIADGRAGRAVAAHRRSRGPGRSARRSGRHASRARVPRHEPPRRRERSRSRPPPARAAVSLCRASTPVERSARGASGRPAPASPEDALARRHHAHRDGAQRADRSARAVDPAAASPPGAVSRDPRAVREPAQPSRADAGVRPGVTAAADEAASDDAPSERSLQWSEGRSNRARIDPKHGPEGFGGPRSCSASLASMPSAVPAAGPRCA